jgi:hypothetical protein
VPVEIEKIVPVTFPIPAPCSGSFLPAQPPEWGEVVELLVEYDVELARCSDKLEAVRERMNSP